METDVSTHSPTLPERVFPRYQPRSDPSDYPRRNGSTSVDDLMQDKAETGNGEHMQHSESGILRERLAYINSERFERGSARQQGGASRAVDTPAPRQREGDDPDTVFGHGARGARTEQLSGSNPYDKYLQWRDERSGSSSTGHPRGGRELQGSFNQRAEPTGQQQAAIGDRQRQPAGSESMAPQNKTKVITDEM